MDLIAAKVAAQLRGSAAENVPGAMAGEQPVRGPAPSAVSARGDSPERPYHREAGGKEGCSGSGVVGEPSETRVPVVGHGHIDTVSKWVEAPDGVEWAETPPGRIMSGQRPRCNERVEAPV